MPSEGGCTSYVPVNTIFLEPTNPGYGTGLPAFILLPATGYQAARLAIALGVWNLLLFESSSFCSVASKRPLTPSRNAGPPSPAGRGVDSLGLCALSWGA